MRTTARSLLGFILCAASSLSAQQGTSSIAGKVTDAQGGVLPGVNIVVTNEDTGVNVTNRANFEPPSGDRRVRANFLRFDDLVGGTGFPRQMQIGVRLGFKASQTT